MKFALMTYPNKARGAQTPSFYIQSRGDNAGRPLKSPIRNCFAVYTDSKTLQEACFCLWKAHRFRIYIHGTAIPLIRITDVIKVLQSIPEETEEARQVYKTVKAYEDLISNTRKKAELLKAQQTAIARRFVEKGGNR